MSTTEEFGVETTYDPNDGGTPFAVQPLDRWTAAGAMKVGRLLAAVPDPIRSEDSKALATDPTMAEYAELRHEVQRAVEGAKAKNSDKYAQYLIGGANGEHPFITPAITLYHRDPLPLAKINGTYTLILPEGEFLVAIDGETQRIAWQKACMKAPELRDRRVPVVIHHGKSISAAKQGFFDLNTREVKPNAAVAISMDTRDPATKIARRVAEESEVLSGRVNPQRRQLRRTDPEVLTISGLRTGIVTSMLGVAGLQVGTRAMDLAEDAALNAVEDLLVDAWVQVADLLADELEPSQRDKSVVSAPAVLAGIGVVLHHVLPDDARRKGVQPWTLDDALTELTDVNWARSETYTNPEGKEVTVHPWEGIAGKATPSGKFSIGGPKEVGHAVAEALEDRTSANGKQVR